MKDISKGLAIGLRGIGIGFAAWATGSAYCCWAFVALIFMAGAMGDWG